MFPKNFYEEQLHDKQQAITEHLRAIVNNRRLPYSIRDSLNSITRPGRRFRPILMLTTNAALGGEWAEIVELGCAIELLHKASIVHDDIIDEDENRRGEPTAWVQYGSRKAIVLGDLLVGLAYEVISHWLSGRSVELHLELHKIISIAFTNTAVGELLDVQMETNDAFVLELMEEVTRLKSGALVSASLEIGAMTAGATADLRKTLHLLGERIGLIFQMMNDINNLTYVDSSSKGRLGGDLKLGKKTLATLVMLNAGCTLQDFVSMDDMSRAKVLSPALTRVREYAEATKLNVAQLPQGSLQEVFTILLQHFEANWFWLELDHARV